MSQKIIFPYVAENNLAEFCDVFCEKQVFSIEESRRILLAAKEAGLKIKLHADQLHQTGAAELAAELGATSADHLEKVSEAGIAALAHSGTVAGLLPGSVFFLSSQNYPPARRLIQAGVPVALATDFNPGTCMSQSMPMMLTLAGLFMKMTPAEAIVAATANGAKAVDRGDQLGNLAEGKPADLVIWNVSDYRQIPYHFGVNLVNVVIKNGKIVVQHKVEQFQ
ncbi:amidohydrolase family protein [bacterium]|nr:amidohydrolase family protein [bacterium]